MSNYNVDQDVIVTFDDLTHHGHIEKIEGGWIYCRILIGSADDYGSITPRLSPHTTVCVRESSVQSVSTLAIDL